MPTKAEVLLLLQVLEDDFEREGNPVFVWNAIGLCRELRVGFESHEARAMRRASNMTEAA